ncbi:MAG: CapA family protein [Bacillota bacterium]
MRTLLTRLLLALLAAGCATPTQAPPAPALAAPALAAEADLELPPLPGVRVERLADPVAALRRGEAAAAVVRGPAPQGLDSFALSVDETVILQAWLDEPLSLTLAEARERLPGLLPPGEPRKGALAQGRLSDLKPGWRAVAVGGVIPTPQTVWSGEYPLAGLVSVVYPPGAAAFPGAEPLRAAAQARPAGEWASLSVAGDFMLARGVARAMREHGTLYPVAKVKEHLSASDLAFANLESPIGVKGRALPGKQIWFRAAPEAVEVLKAAGLDGLTLANNHILDSDEENFLETMDLLRQAGIPWTGGGRDLDEARRPLVLEARGVRIAFLGYSEFADLFFDWHYPRSFAATEERPGVPRIDEAWLAEDIQKARSLADVVAVTLHWGVEFENHPTEEQVRLARWIVDQGADLVLGYHPHAIQGFELYRGKFIAYSLGNFIMDRQDTDLARESMILDFLIGVDGVRQVQVHPVWIHAEQPYMMTGADGAALRAKMQAISGWK